MAVYSFSEIFFTGGEDADTAVAPDNTSTTSYAWVATGVGVGGVTERGGIETGVGVTLIVRSLSVIVRWLSLLGDRSGSFMANSIRAASLSSLEYTTSLFSISIVAAASRSFSVWFPGMVSNVLARVSVVLRMELKLEWPSAAAASFYNELIIVVLGVIGGWFDLIRAWWSVEKLKGGSGTGGVEIESFRREKGEQVQYGPA